MHLNLHLNCTSALRPNYRRGEHSSASHSADVCARSMICWKQDQLSFVSQVQRSPKVITPQRFDCDGLCREASEGGGHRGHRHGRWRHQQLRGLLPWTHQPMADLSRDRSKSCQHYGAIIHITTAHHTDSQLFLLVHLTCPGPFNARDCHATVSHACLPAVQSAQSIS